MSTQQPLDSSPPPKPRQSTEPSPTSDSGQDDDHEADREPSLTMVAYDSPKEFIPPDGGLEAWLVCFTAFCTNGTVFAVINSFGIVSEWLIMHNEASGAMAGAIGSATIGSLFFFSFLSSVITDRAGIRPAALVGSGICVLSLLVSSFCAPLAVGRRVGLLLLTHSILFGAGASLVYTSSLVVLGHYFERRLGLVNGIVTLGSGAFSVPLIRFLRPGLLEPLGLPNTFRVLAAIAALLAAYAVAWRPLRPTRHAELDKYLSGRSSLVESVSGLRIFLVRYFNVSIWRSRGFVVWTVATPVAMLGYFVPFVFLPSFLHQRALQNYNAAVADKPGSSNSSIASAEGNRYTKQAKSDAATLLICIQVASGTARLAAGRLADVLCVNRLRLQQAALCCLGISMTLLPFGRSLPPYVLLALAFGLCDGTFVCLMGPIAFDLVGPSGASQAIGFVLLAMALPTTSGPPLAGFVHNLSGTWDIPFYLAGTTPVLGAIIMFFVPQTVQSFPAASIVEDFDQMAKSNLDVKAYKEGQVKDANGWQRASGTFSLGSEGGGRPSARISHRSLQLTDAQRTVDDQQPTARESQAVNNAIEAPQQKRTRASL